MTILRQTEQALKEKKLLLDATAQTDKIDIDEKRIEAQVQIAGMQAGAKIATSKSQLEAQQQEAGLKMGIEIAKSTMPQQQQQQQQQPVEEQQ